MSQLANAPLVRPVMLARLRVGYDRPLPAHLVLRLSEEFSLVVIRDPRDWAEVQRRLQLRPFTEPLDLTDGCIVGVLADVGEHTQGRWPIYIRRARVEAGCGSIEASFQSGMYYPLRSAAYLTLAYVPHLQNVLQVRINQRVFLIGATSRTGSPLPMLFLGNADP